MPVGKTISVGRDLHADSLETGLVAMAGYVRRFICAIARNLELSSGQRKCFMPKNTAVLESAKGVQGSIAFLEGGIGSTPRD